MKRRSLALVANFHRERRIGRKTANFLGQAQARLQAQGVDFLIEFVLDRPDAPTVAQIEAAAGGIPGSRVHLVDFGNLGISRTFGVHAARADVVCFTDGDDFFSFNWFEDALEFFSAGRRGVVLHTQYMVGFDNEQFIRETTQSTDPWFDPLALAVDWYWSANLAIEADVFASTPIQPYDHERGFGSEDWHWTCNCLAEGIERVALPNTSYFYRVKPDRFALGKVADVIHKASPLFEPDWAPTRPVGFLAQPPPVIAPSKMFFEQAREVERYELGVSYLRAMEVGAETVRHFRPHTPPIVGTVIRHALASGFGQGSVIVFTDGQRLPGGIEMAASLCSAITGAPAKGRLYIVDGDHETCQVRPDGYVIQLADLRAAGMYNDQIDRLIARFFIQNNNLTVFNILSPRNGSRALAFSRATRGSVKRWVNLVPEYGFDALSQSYEELELFASSGLDAENIAVFAKTSIEARRVRGASLLHDPVLEAAYVSGDLGSIGPRAMAWRLPDEGGRVDAHSSPESLVLRVGLPPLADADASRAEGGWVVVDEMQREMARGAREIILVGGEAFLGEQIPERPSAGRVGIRIPGLTIVRLDKPPAYYFRPQVAVMNEALGRGRVPADLAYVGAIGIAGDTFREMLAIAPGPISVAKLVALAVRKAREAGEAIVTLFGEASVVSASSEDLERLGGARLLLGISRRTGGVSAHG
jgi:hypothetical protein